MTAFLALSGVWISPAVAGELAPEVPKATGDPHPEGNAYMRRWHMEMMKHDRDETMYQGVRPVNASLGACFECHTVRDEVGTPVTASDERHFCRTCHEFVAVRVDCFDCHRSTPDDFEEPAPHAAVNTRPEMLWADGDPVGVLEAYLDSLTADRVFQ